MDENEVNIPSDQYNFRNLMTGLILLVLSTFIFLKYFDSYVHGQTFRQSAGIFFCVGFFTIGTMLVFSSLTFKNRMIFLVAPFVVILGTFFIMNFFHLTGISKILSSYPQLQATTLKNQTQLGTATNTIKRLEAQNNQLQALLYLQNAQQNFTSGKRLDAILDELRMAANELQKSKNKGLLKRVNILLSHMEKLPTNVNQEFIELEDLLMKKIAGKE